MSTSIPTPGEATSVDRHAHADEIVAEIAGRQRGLVTRPQLTCAGLTRQQIGHRVARGRLHRVFRGVYLVGHPVPPPLARELAALLARGPTAVLSHRTAAVLWRILPSASGPVHVTVPDRRPRPRAGLRPHHRPLHEQDVRTRHGLRVTSPARTLGDLTPFLDGPTLARAINEAQVLHLATAEELGIENPGVTRSEAERRLRDLLRRANLHPDRFNFRVEGHLVDALFHDAELVLEVDGYDFHHTRARFESDRARDADLTAAGYRVIRVTWKRMTEEPEATVARIAGALALRPPRSPTPPPRPARRS